MIKINTKELNDIISKNNINVPVDYIIKDSNLIFYYFESKNDTDKLKRLSVEFDEVREKELYDNKCIENVNDKSYTYYTYIRAKVGSILRTIFTKDVLLSYDIRKNIIKTMKRINNYSYDFFKDYNLYSRMFLNGYSVVRGESNMMGNKQMFDYIRIQLPVVQCGQSREEVISKIKKYKIVLKDLAYDALIETIGENKAKLMILNDVIYTNDCCLEYNFILK